AQTEDNPRVALAGDVFTSVERLLEADAHTPLVKHRKLLLLSESFEQLEVLGVARSHLQHDAGRSAGLFQRPDNLIQMARVRYLHGDDADAEFSGNFKDPRKAGGAEALKVVGAGAGLVDPHPGGANPRRVQRAG